MKRNIARICLDAAMALLLVLMYKKTAVSLEFHEVGGLVVCGLFLLHNLLNRRWIAAVGRRMFGRGLAPRTRLGYVVDVLLLICMVFIAVSGIMISKTILTGLSGTWLGWKLGHYFASALALVLVGVHIGLHWSFIKHTLAKMVRFPRLVARPVGVALLAAVLVFGGYSMVTSSFAGWLSEPVTLLTAADGSLPLTGGGNGRGLHGAGGTSSPTEVLSMVATYGSIAAVFAALTVFLESLLKRKKRPSLTLRSSPARA